MSPTPLIVHLQERAFTDTFTKLPLTHTLESFEKHVEGGPRVAMIRASGANLTLEQLAAKLRCPVLIYDAAERYAWWGMVYEAWLPDGTGITLDGMANRIRVLYSTGGGGTETDWAEDAQSITAYGYRELKATLSGAGTQTDAEAKRTRSLAALRYPQPAGYQVPLEPHTAELRCRGWWESAGWRYYANAEHHVAYAPKGNIDYKLGSSDDHQIIAQSFQLSGGAVTWLASEVRVKLMKTGTSIAGNVTCDLCAHGGGSPGTPGAVLATCTIAATALDTWLNWVIFPLSVRVQLAPATTYWIKVYRSVTPRRPFIYYKAYTPGADYAAGVLREYGYGGGSLGWTTLDADMKFDVLGTRETTSQISDIVAASCQYLTATSVDTAAASGLYTTPYRDGKNSAQREILSLLARGTSAGRRLQAHVHRDRTLHVEFEPLAGSADWVLQPDGTLLDNRKNPIPAYLAPPGIWLRLPGTDRVNTSSMVDRSRVFVEGWTYDAASGLATPTVRGAPTWQDLMRVKDL